jgi:hypothetical protein
LLVPVRAIGVTTSVEVFNEIIDTFCPFYESDPSSLPEAAKVQILRAIGVAIVKHGSMFPTMEILLRHAVNYLNMGKSKAVTEGGVLDDQTMLLKDFEKISLDESRAVLCTHMLCYVLDGSIGFNELSLWHELCSRVESLYQIEKSRWDTLQEQAAAAANGMSPGIAFGQRNVPVAEQLRKTIAERVPDLALAVARIPTHDAMTEMRELRVSTQAIRPLLVISRPFL